LLIKKTTINNVEGPIKNEEKKPEETSKSQPLSPEVLEKVMEKVCDINGKNVGVNVAFANDASWPLLPNISPEGEDKMKSILENGLLGRSRDEVFKTVSLKDKQEWAREARQHNRDKSCDSHPNVYFILPDISDKIKDAEPMPLKDNIYLKRFGGIALIFDTSTLHFKPHGDYFLNKNEYHIKDYTWDTVTYNEDTGPWQFITKARISPKKFKGLVVLPSKSNTVQEIEGDYIADISAEALSRSLEKIIEIQKSVNIEHQNLLVPIYDVGGNMLWPKQMSYEEVKKFVEERDKEKNEKGE